MEDMGGGEVMYIVQIRISNSDWKDDMQTHERQKALERKNKLEKQNYNVRLVKTIEEE